MVRAALLLIGVVALYVIAYLVARCGPEDGLGLTPLFFIWLRSHLVIACTFGFVVFLFSWLSDPIRTGSKRKYWFGFVSALVASISLGIIQGRIDPPSHCVL